MSGRAHRRDEQAQQESLEADVRQALTAMGWLVPTSEADAAAAEQAPAEAPALSEFLRDAGAVMERPDGLDGPTKTLHLPGDPDVGETLRRAAREAGTIPPEIEEKMRRDRQAAEQALEQGENGESPA